MCSGLAAPVGAAGSLTWTGTVTKVIDGDTVEVDIAGDGKGAVHVRNAGIQAIETGECGAGAATRALAGMQPDGQAVVLRARSGDSTSFDGKRVRPLRYIDTPAGLDVQLRLLKLGLVLAYPVGGLELARQDRYHRVAQRAAQQGVGLYSTRFCARGPQQIAKLRMWVNWKADGGPSNLSGEYARILNEGDSAVDLSGWWLRSPTNTRYRFPAGTQIAPDRHLTVRTGSGRDTSTDLYWPSTHGRWRNPAPDGVHHFGGYLFDPDGDLRAWSMYPCTWGCWEPLSALSNVSWTATYDPPGDDRVDPNAETLNLTNTSSRRIDASYRVFTVKGRVLEFGSGSYLNPGETLRVHMGHGTQRRLHKYLGSDTPKLNNAGGSAALRNTEGMQIGCARWGDSGPAKYRCTDTAQRHFESAALTRTADGTAVQLAVVPAAADLDYIVQRRVDGQWAEVTRQVTGATGMASVPVPPGRYRVVLPAQLGYASLTSKSVYVDGQLPTVAEQPQLRASLAASRGTIKVNVNPNRPDDGSWAFALQRQPATGWESLGTYRTKGSAETRSLRYLESGTYRVRLKAQHGALGGVSPSLAYTAARAELTVEVARRSKLKVDAGPDLPAEKNYRLRIDRRSSGGWVTYRRVATDGGSERVTVDVPRGRYRVRLPDQRGYLGVRSARRYVSR